MPKQPEGCLHLAGEEFLKIFFLLKKMQSAKSPPNIFKTFLKFMFSKVG
jgi:hypothetical protein